MTLTPLLQAVSSILTGVAARLVVAWWRYHDYREGDTMRDRDHDTQLNVCYLRFIGEMSDMCTDTTLSDEEFRKWAVKAFWTMTNEKDALDAEMNNDTIPMVDRRLRSRVVREAQRRA